MKKYFSCFFILICCWETKASLYLLSLLGPLNNFEMRNNNQEDNELRGIGERRFDEFNRVNPTYLLSMSEEDRRVVEQIREEDRRNSYINTFEECLIQVRDLLRFFNNININDDTDSIYNNAEFIDTIKVVNYRIKRGYLIYKYIVKYLSGREEEKKVKYSIKGLKKGRCGILEKIKKNDNANTNNSFTNVNDTDNIITCLICLDEKIYENKRLCDGNKPEDFVMTPCGHFFCKKSLKTWFNRKKECPMCRHELENFFINESSKIDENYVNYGLVNEDEFNFLQFKSFFDPCVFEKIWEDILEKKSEKQLFLQCSL